MNKSLSYAEKQAKARIKQMSGFRSTLNYPSPCYLPFGNELDDLAAVIAGSKPSAMFPAIEPLKNNECFEALLLIAYENNICCEEYQGYFFIGDKNTVKTLQNIFDEPVDNKSQSEIRNTKLGNILGYCKDAIDEFVKYSIHQGLSYKERTFRRTLRETK